MRQLTDHIVEGDSTNHQLEIQVIDEPGKGGANNAYAITGFDISSNPSAKAEGVGDGFFDIVLFQNGPIREFGVNGVTHEALLAIVIDRLKCYQAGPYSCSDNEQALNACHFALSKLQNRTRARIARGVEGTHIK